MTFTERTRLLGFGLFGWVVAMFTAADHPGDSFYTYTSAAQAGLMAACFATALLPGRMARFS